MMHDNELKRPRVGVGVFVCRGDKFVLMQRKNAHGEGSWAPSGGHLEFGETWEECARRETREELGVEIENVQFFGVTNDVFQTEGKHYITIYLRADLCAGQEPRNGEPEKTVALQWATWQTLPSPMFLPCTNFLASQFSPLRSQT